MIWFCAPIFDSISWLHGFPDSFFCVVCRSMIASFEKQVSQTLEEIKSQGLLKTERVITTPQDATLRSPAANAC
jgi:hypothetical protein